MSRTSDETIYGKDAYFYLLEVICGLKSKLIGENEIVGQFKTAYQEYTAQNTKDNNVLLILEKLFKDAKEIRSTYLLGLSQKTYASLARKHIINKHKADKVLVLGSGHLAEDLINQFKKKAKVYISARNLEKANALAVQHDLNIVPWNNLNMYEEFPFIANSIGFDGTLLDEEFFSSWSQKHESKLLVDLGAPSAIKTALTFNEGVMRLDDIFKEGAVHETHKKNQIENARLAMTKLVERRYIHLKEKQKNSMNLGGKIEHQNTI
jgi:glutamyl-tRNA reductase